jgi:trk system potassium uptake protein TrkH
MPDPRAPVHLIGLAVLVLGAAMLLPMLADLWAGDPNWRAFAGAAFLTTTLGAIAWRATAGVPLSDLDLRQIFLLTTTIWLALPVFGALPFMLGAPGVQPVDAFFEAMSGLTTTGSTVFGGLQDLPAGTLLWRGLLQWIGGIGVVVVAGALLPALRVGGMQIFRAEGFDTQGAILPRAGSTLVDTAGLYLGLTLACLVAYSAAGMSLFDAAVHAMTTIATGGFANHDLSLAFYGAGAQYVAILFMLTSALPFLALAEAARGRPIRLIGNSQARAFLATVACFAAAVFAARLLLAPPEGLAAAESRLRESLFNTVSLITGTGYASADYNLWGAFAVGVLFLGGLVGGCAPSTSCSIKVFRYQIMFAAIAAQLRRIHSPHAATPMRYEGRRVDEDVVSSVMAFLFLFVLSLAVLAITLGLMGYDAVTAVSGAATALANVGPGFGPLIGPTGSFAELSDAAKWLLAFAMLLGRLELMAVFALFTAAYWRA